MKVMDRTAIPTMNLRFVTRTVKVSRPYFGGGVEEQTIRVLQQQFDTITAGMHWVDVPCVTETADEVQQ